MRARRTAIFLSAILWGDTLVWKRSHIQNAHSTATTTAARISTQLIYGAQWRDKNNNSRLSSCYWFTIRYLLDSGFDMCAITIFFTKHPTTDEFIVLFVPHSLDSLAYFQLSIPQPNRTMLLRQSIWSRHKRRISWRLFFFFSSSLFGPKIATNESIKAFAHVNSAFHSHTTFRSILSILLLLLFSSEICPFVLHTQYSSIKKQKIVCDRVARVCVCGGGDSFRCYFYSMRSTSHSFMTGEFTGRTQMSASKTDTNSHTQTKIVQNALREQFFFHCFFFARLFSSRS